MAATVPQSPAYAGETVDLVAEVQAASGIPSGTVTFSVGAKRSGSRGGGGPALCSSTLVAHRSGPVGHTRGYATAACSSSAAPVGDLTIIASYAGNATYAPSGATSDLVVYSPATTTRASVSPPVTGEGTTVTYHATVTAAGPAPAGSVTFSVTGVTTGGGLSGIAVPETTAQCSGTLVNGSASCRAKVPPQADQPGTAPDQAISGDIVNAPNDVTATYVPSGHAYLRSSGRATLEVVDFNGGNTDLDGATLDAVSCATANFCVVVDKSGDELTYSDGHWSVPRDVEPATYQGIGLTSVSCPSTRFCAAVGGNPDGSGSVVMFNGTSWSSPQTLAASPPSPEGALGLEAVSCASSTFCMAADAYGNAYYYDGGAWSGPMSLNLPAADDRVTSLSCTKPDYCNVVTFDAYSANLVGAAGGLFLQYRDGGTSYLSSVSCAAPSECTAVGNGKDGGAIEQGGHLVNVDRPLSAVSCPTTTFCVAVGDGDTATSSLARPFELTYAGSSWSPRASVGALGPDLSSISCPSSTFCMAVGDQQVVTWTGGSARPTSSTGTGGQPGPTSTCPACGPNLILNPGAEAGPGANSDTSVLVPDWEATGAFTAEQYAWSDGDYSATTPGPADRGRNYFSGGWDSPVSTGSQTIEVAGGALGGHATTYTLSAWLGGYSVWGDNATLSAQFRSATGAVLGSAHIASPTAAQRDNNTEMVLTTTSGTVPAATRQILVTLVFRTLSSGYSGGAADNLSLVLS
jgi:hypothetical protein